MPYIIKQQSKSGFQSQPKPNRYLYLLGVLHVPGLFYQRMVEGWKLVTKAVHEQGTKNIYPAMAMQAGLSHVLNQPGQASLVGV